MTERVSSAYSAKCRLEREKRIHPWPSSKLCISKAFHIFATGKTSPISDWLRVVCAEVNRRVGRGVGVIGLCLTGGLALVLIAEPAVVTAVFAVIESPDPNHDIGKGAHAVLTKEYRDDPGQPTFAAYQRVVDFLRTQMGRA